jgi:fatty-acyl-CoA synthase
MGHIYDTGLDKNEANFVALSPISFLKRVARVHPKSISLVYEDIRHTWAETYGRCCRLAS